MAIIAGGSIAGMANGMTAVERVRSDYVSQYLTRLHYVGINKQASALHPDLVVLVQ